MRVLIDTNVLLRAVQRQHLSCPVAISALKSLRRQGYSLCLVPQNIFEFWNICTRPASANGLGLSVTEADRYVSRFDRIFPILPDSIEILGEWRSLAVQLNITGVSVHDARLVADMKVHSISKILTFDTSDFARYKNIQAIHPQTV